jgi:hypothetical protein
MIGGCGLAGMIWRLARYRKLPSLKDPRPVERHEGMEGYYPASTEFYRLTDLAWNNWKYADGKGVYSTVVRL